MKKNSPKWGFDSVFKLKNEFVFEAHSIYEIRLRNFKIKENVTVNMPVYHTKKKSNLCCRIFFAKPSAFVIIFGRRKKIKIIIFLLGSSKDFNGKYKMRPFREKKLLLHGA